MSGWLMRSVLLAGLALSILSAGCDYAVPSTANDAKYLPTLPYDPTIGFDSYSPTIDVRTEAGQRGQAPYGIEVLGLYAKINKSTGATVAYLQWSEAYTDSNWRFYNRASTDKAKPLSFDQVDRTVGRCGAGTCVYSETYNIMLPLADLEAGTTDGLRLKIYGKSGEERIVVLPGFTIRPFMAKVAEAQAMRAKRS